MNSLSVGKVPAVPGGVMTLEDQIAAGQLFVFYILNQNIFKGELFIIGAVNVGAVRAVGKMLGTII